MKYQPKPFVVSGYVLLSLRGIALTASILLTSSILAFIGLGLTFWGAFLLFIKPVKYVRADLLDSTAISSLTTIDYIISNLNCKGKGIYLPPKYFKCFTHMRATVFAPIQKRNNPTLN